MTPGYIRRTPSGLAVVDDDETYDESPTRRFGSMILRPKEFTVPFFDAERFAFTHHNPVTFAFRDLDYATSMLHDMFMMVCEFDVRSLTLKVFLVCGATGDIRRLVLRKRAGDVLEEKLRFDASVERFLDGCWQQDDKSRARIEATMVVTSALGMIDMFQAHDDGFAVVQLSRD